MFVTLLILHVVAATVWTGGHLILSAGFLPRTLRFRDATTLIEFEERYERIGIPALVVLIATGLWLAGTLVEPSVWLTQPGPMTGLIRFKLGLLVATAVLAIDARFRIIPRMTPERINSLSAHIITVTILSVVFVVAGVGLSVGGF